MVICRDWRISSAVALSPLVTSMTGQPRLAAISALSSNSNTGSLPRKSVPTQSTKSCSMRIFLNFWMMFSSRMLREPWLMISRASAWVYAKVSAYSMLILKCSSMRLMSGSRSSSCGSLMMGRKKATLRMWRLSICMVPRAMALFPVRGPVAVT